MWIPLRRECLLLPQTPRVTSAQSQFTQQRQTTGVRKQGTKEERDDRVCRLLTALNASSFHSLIFTTKWVNERNENNNKASERVSNRVIQACCELAAQQSIYLLYLIHVMGYITMHYDNKISKQNIKKNRHLCYPTSSLFKFCINILNSGLFDHCIIVFHKSLACCFVSLFGSKKHKTCVFLIPLIHTGDWSTPRPK